MASESKGDDAQVFPKIGEMVADETSDVSKLDALKKIEDCWCPACGQTGTTNIIMTTVPYFREIVIMAFTCDSCGFRSNEVQHGGSIQEKCVAHTLTVADKEDLNRQIIKADSCSVKIPELDFEIPSKTQRGVMTTIEGLLSTAIDSLRQSLVANAGVVDPGQLQGLTDFIMKLSKCISGEDLPFTFVLDDPAGNSHIENPTAPAADPNLKTVHYVRTHAQNVGLALAHPEDDPALKKAADEEKAAAEMTPEEAAAAKEKAWIKDGLDSGERRGYIEFKDDHGFSPKEVHDFETECYNCGALGKCRMCLTDIPHFKEVILMCQSCDSCGYKTTEVKAGGEIGPKGRKVTLKLDPANPADWQRDVLLSGSSSVSVPELDMYVEGIEGVYTTVEGLMAKMKDRVNSANPFQMVRKTRICNDKTGGGAR